MEFKADDLHMVAKLVSGPLIAAIRSDSLRFDSHAWSDRSYKALEAMWQSQTDKLSVAVYKCSLCFDESPDWIKGLLSLRTTFGLEHEFHLFKVEMSDGADKLKETYATKQLAQFLDTYDEVVRKGRVCALLKTLGVSEDVINISEVQVKDEELTTGNKRIDVIVKWKDSSGNECVAVIEAKFDHHLTPGQLETYRRHVRSIPKNRRWLVIVSPQRTRDVDESLKKRGNREWVWLSWHDLLLAHERNLADEFDSIDYLHFRRKIWDRTA